MRHLVISTWRHTGNWICVVLSRQESILSNSLVVLFSKFVAATSPTDTLLLNRCTTLKGIFLRRPLDKTRPMCETCEAFLNRLRKEKMPPMLKNDNPCRRKYSSLRRNTHKRCQTCATETVPIDQQNNVKKQRKGDQLEDHQFQRTMRQSLIET